MANSKLDMQVVDEVRKMLDKNEMNNETFIKKLIETRETSLERTPKIFFLKRQRLTNRIEVLHYLLKEKTKKKKQPDSESDPVEWIHLYNICLGGTNVQAAFPY